MKHPARFTLFTLAFLAILQTCWWAYLIIHRQSEYRTMIFAESLFFIFVWILGTIIIFRSLKRELRFQKAHSDFLSAITHELKTPLTNLRLTLDSLERPLLSDELKKSFLDRGQQAIDKLLGLIEGLLLISQDQKSADSLSDFSLQQLLDECLKGRPSDIRLQGSTDIKVRAPFRESLLIVSNLIDNALKYSDSNISITVTTDLNQAAIEIQDSGIGFTTEELSHAFQPFYRGERGRKRDPTGTGVGLTLVKKLAQSNAIEVDLQSDGPMKGTKAIVRWKTFGKDLGT